jgi:hypothetical protein
VLLLTGCSADDDAQAAPDEPQLSAVSVYGRHAAVRGRVDVRLANGGDRAVDVEALRVDHPMFAAVPALQRRSTLPPDGRARIVPVPFGAARCDVDDPAGARVVVGVRSDDGVHEVSVPLADGEPGLVRAHRLACAVERVGEVVEVALDGWTVGPDLVGTGVLRLVRRSAGEVTVASVGSTILFSVEPGPEPLLQLGPDSSAAAAPLRLRAARCDPHALTESKRSFSFPAFVALDDDEPARVEVTVTGTGREVLQDLLARTCGPAG